VKRENETNPNLYPKQKCLFSKTEKRKVKQVLSDFGTGSRRRI
jgi:hypothetical protein